MSGTDLLLWFPGCNCEKHDGQKNFAGQMNFLNIFPTNEHEAVQKPKDLLYIVSDGSRT
jgi:hypothetical protein